MNNTFCDVSLVGSVMQNAWNGGLYGALAIGGGFELESWLYTETIAEGRLQHTIGFVQAVGIGGAVLGSVKGTFDYIISKGYCFSGVQSKETKTTKISSNQSRLIQIIDENLKWGVYNGFKAGFLVGSMKYVHAKFWVLAADGSESSKMSPGAYLTIQLLGHFMKQETKNRFYESMAACVAGGTVLGLVSATISSLASLLKNY